MSQFDPHAYGPAWAELLVSKRTAALGPGKADQPARQALRQLTPDTAFAPAQIHDIEMAQLCIAGVWLLHDFLDESHQISQQFETPSGSYWHGIMHRREPDYANAKYWFRRVGQHAVYQPLLSAARDAAAGLTLDDAAQALVDATQWNPLKFVDLCESVERGNSQSRDFCLAVAQREWELLFDDCYRAAVS